MKTKIFYLLLLFCIPSFHEIHAEIIKQERSVRPFVKIDASVAVGVHFTQSDKYEVIVETHEDTQENIIVRNSGSTLIVKVENKKNKSINHIKVYISAPTLESINLSSASSFNCTTLKLKEPIWLDASSASSINIGELIAPKGFFTFSSASSGNIDKCNMNEVKLSVSSAANFKGTIVNADMVEANVSSASNITLKGKTKDLDISCSSVAKANISGMKYKNLKAKEDNLSKISK